MAALSVGVGSIATVFDNGRTRVWRTTDLDGCVSIRKEALGPWALERIAHETAILDRLDGVVGVPRMRQAPDPLTLVVVDPDARVLGEILTERRLRVVEVVALGAELARILAAVHEAGVAHHDLHPGNVLLATDGRVELIDFDLATTVAEVRPAFTHHREILGRLPYLSPEQTGRTGSPIDRRSDLYALGAVLYEAATGSPPFSEQEPLELVREILTREPIPVGRLDPAVPAPLEAVIARLLEKDPDLRYQSAAGVAHDLARIAADPAVPFPLGERDFPSRLSPPTRLVGRDAEIAVMAEAVDAIARPGGPPGSRPPACRVVLVGGGAGVGKSALVDTLRPLVTRRGGWFVTGKADRVVTDSSTGLQMALRRVARLLLAEPPAALEAQAAVLRDRLGLNAAALVSVAPEFARVLGGLPETGEMGGRELEDRTRQAVVELLRVVASPTRPLVLVLDDIQWASSPALDVLDAIVSDPGVSGLLLVGAYRDGEVDDARLGAMSAGWERLRIAQTTLHLTPLDRDDLATLLGRVLRLPHERAVVLAEVMWEPTAGNPFDTIELLNFLRENGALEQTDDGWTWDAAVIAQYAGRGDIIALLAARIDRLGPVGAQVLAAMACLGGEVSTADLAIACGLTVAQVLSHLTGPLESGHVVPIGQDPGARDAELRFRHDRMRQAALARLGVEERRMLQARLGGRLATAGLDLPAAQQFLAAGVVPSDPHERRLRVRLYRAAAAVERRRTDFAHTEQYLAAAVAILRDEPASAAEQERVEVECERHQVLYLLGRLEEADGVHDWLCRRTQDVLVLAQVTAVQVASLTNRHETRTAVELGLDMLARLGMPFPADGAEATVVRGLAEVATWTATLDAAADAARPALSDPTAAAVVAVMDRLSAPAFFSAPLVSAWLVIQAKRLWVDHGPHGDLLGVLGHGPVAFISVLDEFRAGEVLLAHLVAVGEVHRWERAVAYVRFLYAVSCAHWFEPLDACRVVAATARDRLLHVGDLPQACWAYYPLVISAFEAGPTLDHPLAELAAAMAMADRTGILPVRHCFWLIRRFCLDARGIATGPSDVGAQEAEARTIEALAGAIPLVGTYYRLYRSIAAALAGDLDLLAAHSREAFRLAQGLPGIAVTLLATVPFGLDLSMQLRQLSAEDPAHAELLAELDGMLGWLRRRAVDQPDNVAHLVHYLEAERAWSLGDHAAAIVAFDAALAAVAGLCRPWHHALLARRAGELHRDRGLEHSGRLHLGEARRALLDWGADALVTTLEHTYPFLADRTTGPAGIASPSMPASPARFTADAVDTTAILRVAQALAEQTTMAQLHATIADQLSAITGATSVSIVLRDENGGWRIPAGDTVGGPALDDEAAATVLPVSAVRYVVRTGRVLVVNDATVDDRFALDPYLRGRQRLALLVVPVMRSGDMRAVLVLGNRLTSGTFTADRLGFVEMIIGQLAVAIDNAMLYASLERRIAERTEELHAANAQLEWLSETDGLTGVANRRRFDAALAAEWSRSSGRPVSVIMVDVDHFKKYNDHLGHPAGDRCLVAVTRLLAGSLRDSDLLCRYGGEEFAVILPHTDQDTAVIVAERMRAAVEDAALPHSPTVGTVTVSIGAASSAGPAGSPVRPVSELLAHADAALYEAKHAGRNCVRAAARPRRAKADSAATP